MNYSGINKNDIANGPGWRISLFVSGCRNCCPGCFNKEAWDFEYGQKFTGETAYELLRALESPHISGLSILGGDPFEPENREIVEVICKIVKAEFPTNKTVWVWTGYLYEDLKNLEIMKYIDVLVDGRFEQDKKDLRLAWRGSSNQRVIDVKKSRETGEVVLFA